MRVLWPFIRYLSSLQNGNPLLDVALANATLADPNGRLPLKDAAQLLTKAVHHTGDPAIGLHAATFVEPSDRDVLEFAARSCETLEEALRCTIRYYRLLTDAAEYALHLRTDFAIFERVSLTGRPAPPAATDYALSSMVFFLRRNAMVDESLCVLEFAHPPPSYVELYGKLLRTSLRFSEGRNALVLPRAFLSTPMRAHCPLLKEAFILRAEELLAGLPESSSTADRVRAHATLLLSSGQLSMERVSRALALSPATLRRHLEAEGCTFSGIVAEVRQELARAKLEGERSISEVAFSLGFSNVSSFDRAFRRWFGIAPGEYRTRLNSNGKSSEHAVRAPDRMVEAVNQRAQSEG